MLVSGLLPNTVIMIIGMGILWWSANFTVSNAEKLVKSLGISSFLFGAVFVSVSTGLPEIATAIVSALSDVAELSAGDVTGSSLVNLTFVLGAAILAGKGIKMTGEDLDLIRDASVGIVIATIGLLFASELTFPVVVLLFSVYGLYLYEAEHTSMSMDDDAEVSKLTAVKAITGVLLILGGARLVVGSAEQIGLNLGIPIELIGATVVAVGTGLPELAFETAAVKRGDTELAIGDIFGSALVNITLTLGILGTLATPSLVNLTPVLLILLPLVGVVILFSREGEFSRTEALILEAIFVAYLVYQIWTVL